MAGYGALTIQQYGVYDNLADVLESDFAGGNDILLELQDFYDSCTAAQEANITAALIPAVRKLYHDIGQYIHVYTCVGFLSSTGMIYSTCMS